MTETTPLRAIAEKLARRNTGDWGAADAHWAEDLVVWHAFDDREQRIPGSTRGAHSGAKLEAFAAAMHDFRRASTFHVSESTNTIVELSVWQGSMPTGADGVVITVDAPSCTVYTVDGETIVRLDIFDDSSKTRALGELTAHGQLPATQGAAR